MQLKNMSSVHRYAILPFFVQLFHICMFFFFSFFLPDESATIRVTNLSEDTRESDLQELFRPFGPIQRIYLAKDKNTGQSKVSMKIYLLFGFLHQNYWLVK